MGSSRYKRLKANGVLFVFSYDKTAPDLLHIFVRHLVEPSHAIETFFDGETTWNAKHKRFETYTKSHGLYWFWLNEKKKHVMVISCFKTEESIYESEI